MGKLQGTSQRSPSENSGAQLGASTNPKAWLKARLAGFDTLTRNAGEYLCQTSDLTGMGPPQGPFSSEFPGSEREFEERHVVLLGDQTHLDAMNKGSFGHPELCHKPCQFFSIGQCEMGRSCGYCHMPRTRPPVMMERKGRERLAMLPPDRLLDIFLPILFERAEASELQMEVAPLLARLSQLGADAAEVNTPEAGAAGAGGDSEVSLKNIRKVLRKMTMASLIQLLCRLCSEEAFVPALMEELASLQQTCGRRVHL